METNNNTPTERSSQQEQNGPDLIGRCRAGDTAAFNEFVQRYQNKVFSYLRYALGDETLAAEATRRTFVSAYKNIKRVPAEIPVKTWLLKIAEEELIREAGKQKAWYAKILPKSWFRSSKAPDAEDIDVPGPKDPGCESIRALLSEYLDDELNELDGKRVDKHLRSCSACFQEFDELQDTVMLVQSFGPKRAPIELRPQINAEIEKLVPLRERIRFFQNLPLLQGVSATLTVLMLFGAAFLVREMQENQRLRRQVLEHSAVRGSEPSEHPAAPEPGIFVILTGSLISEESVAELGSIFKTLDLDLKTAPPRFIPGEQEALLDTIRSKIQEMHGEVIEEHDIRKNGLKIEKLVVEVPQDANQMFSLFLQQLKSTENQPEPETLSLEIYLIDKL